MRELAVELGAGLAVGEMQSSDLSLAHTRKTLRANNAAQGPVYAQYKS